MIKMNLQIKQFINFWPREQQSLSVWTNSMNESKRLVKGEKKLFGVCSGIANYFEADPTLIRLLFIIAVFGFGTGVLYTSYLR